MKAIYYRWSGDHKTVVDLGNRDVIAVMYLRIAISDQREYFKQQVQIDPLDTRWLRRIKLEIRSMKELADVLSSAIDDADITNQAEAAKAAYSMIMPWRN